MKEETTEETSRILVVIVEGPFRKRDMEIITIVSILERTTERIVKGAIIIKGKLITEKIGIDLNISIDSIIEIKFNF